MMKLLEEVKEKITYLHTCSAAYILAHAAWSACDHRSLPGPSTLEVSAQLDDDNIKLIGDLQRITRKTDYSNTDQAEMLRWLDSNCYSSYVAKQVKITKKKLVDWV
jgi:hypothetical protein